MFSPDDQSAATRLVIAALRKTLPKATANSPIDGQTLMKDELDMDSLGMMSLLVLLEKETRLSLRGGALVSAFGRCRHADDIVALLDTLTKDRAEASGS